MAIMSTQLIFSLILAFLVCGAHMATVSITNNCAYTVWPGTLANADHPQLAETGFELATRGTKTLNIPAKWAGSFWARTQCSGSFTCATADCGSGQVACNGKGAVPPVSLVAIAFQSDDGQDFYTLSGFNLPVSVAPENGSGSKCIEATCLANANQCGQGYSSPSDPSSVLACTSGTNYAITFCP